MPLLHPCDDVQIARNTILLDATGQPREWTAGNFIWAQLPGGEADAATALIMAPALPEVLNTRAAWLTVPAPVRVSGATLPARGLPAAGRLSDLAAALATTSALGAVRKARFPAQGCGVRGVGRAETRHKAGHETHARDPQRRATALLRTESSCQAVEPGFVHTSAPFPVTARWRLRLPAGTSALW